MTSQEISSECCIVYNKFKPFTGECAKLPADEDTEYWAGRYGFAFSPSDGEGMEDENKVAIDENKVAIHESRKEKKKKRKRSSSSSSSSSADRADVKALEDAARAALESQVKVKDEEDKTDDVPGSKTCKILKDLIAQYKSAIADKVPPRSDVYNQYMRAKAKDATMQAQFESAKGCKNKREKIRTEWLQNVVEVKKNRAATNANSDRRGF